MIDIVDMLDDHHSNLRWRIVTMTYGDGITRLKAEALIRRWRPTVEGIMLRGAWLLRHNVEVGPGQCGFGSGQSMARQGAVI